MNAKVHKLNANDIGEEVTVKEVRFLNLLDQDLSRDGATALLPASLAERVQILRDKARRNLDAERQEM